MIRGMFGAAVVKVVEPRDYHPGGVYICAMFHGIMEADRYAVHLSRIRAHETGVSYEVIPLRAEFITELYNPAMFTGENAGHVNENLNYFEKEKK